ncbi:hypothetical protein JOC78_000728 [Bacillus ectoiniformans]|uniref:hypothetical protein n=1 Tax=Bacillus ectoiniformans TaxID=1494429 RepID=UPI0019597348|nr:hypothetical protein [Bacillus ectoiniformans]MBM7647788.1 hypothetical protein [Bacillus ectoiniformans]
MKAGFTNTIKWNARQIYFVLEYFMNMADASYNTKAKDYNPYSLPARGLQNGR